jgi:hypothetical protein
VVGGVGVCWGGCAGGVDAGVYGEAADFVC